MNFYEILGVAKQATYDEIRDAYRKMAFLHHPDRCLGDMESCEKFKQAAQAYATLSDPHLRVRYDLTMHVQKPQKKKIEKKSNPLDGFTYADVPRSEVDLWGEKPKKGEKFKDVFSYENDDQLHIR